MELPPENLLISGKMASGALALASPLASGAPLTGKCTPSQNQKLRHCPSILVRIRISLTGVTFLHKLHRLRSENLARITGLQICPKIDILILMFAVLVLCDIRCCCFITCCYSSVVRRSSGYLAEQCWMSIE